MLAPGEYIRTCFAAQRDDERSDAVSAIASKQSLSPSAWRSRGKVTSVGLQLTDKAKVLLSRKERDMSKKPVFRSWSARQAVAILAVDNISPSEHGLDVLQRIEDGLITHEQAREEILRRARAIASATKEQPPLQSI